jgi:lysophospholipase L1-like esterase
MMQKAMMQAWPRVSHSGFALTAAALVSLLASCSTAGSAGAPSPVATPRGAVLLPASDERIGVMGRTERTREGGHRFGYPGVTLRLALEGPSVSMRARSTSGDSRLSISVDGAAPHTLRLTQGEADWLLADGLGSGEHQIEIAHRTETWQGVVSVLGFTLPRGARLLSARPFPERRLLVIGDSVTSGEGVDRPEECQTDKPASANALGAYGMLLARALDAQVHLVSYGGRGLIRDWQGKRDTLNAPQFFDLTIAEESPRVLWNHATYRPDAVLISLGTNDFNLGLGALPEKEEYVGAYDRFLGSVRAVYPAAHVFLTEGAMVNDQADPARPQKTVLREYLREVVTRLGDPKVSVIPSEHYPGDRCDSHPTAAQHQAMARDLEALVRSRLSW